MRPTEVIIRPLLTEKASLLKDNQKQFVFVVKPKATKGEISKAVQLTYDVTVAQVRTVIGRTKAKRRRHGLTLPRLYKKAIVTLREGQSIPGLEKA